MAMFYYHIVPSTIGSIRCSLRSSVAVLITLFVIGVIYFPRENGRLYDQKEDLLTDDHTSKFSPDQNHSSDSCDLFSGKWVFDNKSYPLYKEEECTFISNENACQKYGRKDINYRHWRWQPHKCNLPRSFLSDLSEPPHCAILQYFDISIA